LGLRYKSNLARLRSQQQYRSAKEFRCDISAEIKTGQYLRRPLYMRALGQNDVVRLLRSEVKRAGGQQEWARKHGVVPSMISMVLSGDRPPNKKIISALKLRRIVVFERVR
jgi:hypothetical protein